MPAAVTVIGTIESPKAAQKLIDELVEAGFKDRDVEILEGDEDELVAEIVGRGFDKEDARGYAEAAGRGKTVVAARASEEAEAAFAEKTVEMLGTSEEASVRKEARVVGEVALGKRVEEHKETVKDSVRRTEVDVEEIKPGSSKRR